MVKASLQEPSVSWLEGTVPWSGLSHRDELFVVSMLISDNSSESVFSFLADRDRISQ